MARDVEVRYTQTNTLVASFSLAVNRRFAKKDDEKQADFINIVAWDKVGEFCSKYFKKGQQVAVVGRLQTRKYEDKDGKTVFVTEVIAEECYFADTKHEEQNPFTEQPQQQNIIENSDELPF